MAFHWQSLLVLAVPALGLRQGRQTSSAGCGARGNGLGAQIINGDDAKQCDWIWQAQVVTMWDNNVTCGGTLIGDKWVLTAAHCTFGKPSHAFEVVLGNYHRSGRTAGSVSRPVANIYHNPSFNFRYLRNNMALVELASPVALEGCIGSVCLPEADETLAEGEECMISGWGTTRIGEYRYSQTLLEAQITTVSNEACKQEGAYPTWAITPDMVCASGHNAKGEPVDACHGDYGGPMVCQTAGTWYLQGVSSFSYGCARDTHPGVYARTTGDVRSWIKEVTGI